MNLTVPNSPNSSVKARQLPTAKRAKQALAALADPERAQNLARFFKTGPGEYGEGFRRSRWRAELGEALNSPARKIARKQWLAWIRRSRQSIPHEKDLFYQLHQTPHAP